MKKSHKRKLSAILLLILILLIIAVVLIFKDQNLLSGKYRLYLITDNVEGLMIKDAVMIKGMNVGKVKDISFLEDGSARIRVLMKLDKKIKIPLGSSAKISENQNTGAKFIEIVSHDSDIFFKDRDTFQFLKGSDSIKADDIQHLQEKTGEMLGSFDTLVQITELLARYNKEIVDAVESNIQTEENDLSNDVIYRIQILTSSSDIPLNDKRFEGLSDVWKYSHNDIYKYTAGKTDNYQVAIDLKNKIQEKGYKGAFIVAFKKGERISTEKK